MSLILIKLIIFVGLGGITSQPGGPIVNNDLVVRALNYHGQQLTSFFKDTKVFEELDLKNVDYHVYHQRSKELRMEDRGKRLLLHRYCYFTETFENISILHISLDSFHSTQRNYSRITLGPAPDMEMSDWIMIKWRNWQLFFLPMRCSPTFMRMIGADISLM